MYYEKARRIVGEEVHWCTSWKESKKSKKVGKEEEQMKEVKIKGEEQFKSLNSKENICFF